MGAESILGSKCFLAMVTIVAEVTREVNTFNMVTGMTLLRILLSAQGALVARPPILKHRLLHVLVKRLSFIRSA